MTEPAKKRGRPRKTVNIQNSTNLSDETVTEVVKKVKHPRPKRSEAYKEHVEPGEMSKMIMNSMGLRKMGQVEIDITDPKAVEKRIDDFIMYCIEHDMKPTVESMALAFGTNRVQLWRWKEGVGTEGGGRLPESVRKALCRGYDLMNELMTQIMSEGKINPVSAIFLLKNNHAYKDQTDVVVAPAEPYQGISAEDVRDKYIEGVPDKMLGDGSVE